MKYTQKRSPRSRALNRLLLLEEEELAAAVFVALVSWKSTSVRYILLEFKETRGNFLDTPLRTKAEEKEELKVEEGDEERDLKRGREGVRGKRVELILDF
jgi:hypothetical protein